MVHKKRHIAKAISYRILSSGLGLIVAYFMTGSWQLGVTWSLFELVFKPLQYYFHERVWYRYISFGLKTKENE